MEDPMLSESEKVDVKSTAVDCVKELIDIDA